jgi:hypothetical protein
VDLYLGMLQRWWQARLAGDDHPMVDRRHATRRQLNRLARQLLRTHGELGDEEITASGDRRFATGDRVVARMANRNLHVRNEPGRYVRNGATGTVVGVHRARRPDGDRLRVDFDGIGVIELPRSFFDEHAGPGGRVDVGVDHAYAVTSYAVQGATYTTSTSRIDDGATRAETYVDITRGRHANHLFLTRSPDPLDGEHLPKVPPPPVVEAVGGALAQSRPEWAAIEADPSISAASAGQPWQRGQAEARLARHAPPADLLERLPQRSPLPHLARRWDETVATIVVYRTEFDPRPGAEPHAWALGGMPAAPRPRDARHAAARAIDALAVATVRDALRDHGIADLTPWMTAHTEHLAAEGRLGIDSQRLGDLYARVAAYRQAARIPDDVTRSEHPVAALLGPQPEQPLLRATRDGLAAELAALEPPAPAAARAL